MGKRLRTKYDVWRKHSQAMFDLIEAWDRGAFNLIVTRDQLRVAIHADLEHVEATQARAKKEWHGKYIKRGLAFPNDGKVYHDGLLIGDIHANGKVKSRRHWTFTGAGKWIMANFEADSLAGLKEKIHGQLRPPL